MCQSSCDDWDDCVSCTTCNEACSTSCTKHGVCQSMPGLFERAGNRTGVEKQSSQLQQEGQDEEKQEINSSEQDERGHGH